MDRSLISLCYDDLIGFLRELMQDKDQRIPPSLELSREFRSPSYPLIHSLLENVLQELISHASPNPTKLSREDEDVPGYLYLFDASTPVSCRRDDGIEWDDTKKMSVKLIICNSDSGVYKLKNTKTDVGTVVMRRQTWRGHRGHAGWRRNEYKLVVMETYYKQTPDGRVSVSDVQSVQDVPVLVHYFYKPTLADKRAKQMFLSAKAGGPTPPPTSASSLVAAPSHGESSTGAPPGASSASMRDGGTAPHGHPTRAALIDASSHHHMPMPPLVPSCPVPAHIIAERSKDVASDGPRLGESNSPFFLLRTSTQETSGFSVSQAYSALKQSSIVGGPREDPASQAYFPHRDIPFNPIPSAPEMPKPYLSPTLPSALIKSESYEDLLGLSPSSFGNGMREDETLAATSAAAQPSAKVGPHAPPSDVALADVVAYAPDSGPNVESTRVIVVVNGFRTPPGSTYSYACMFGDVEVPAMELAPRSLAVLAPPHGAGVVYFWVICRGVEKGSTATTTVQYSCPMPFYYIPMDDTGRLSLSNCVEQSSELGRNVSKFKYATTELDLSDNKLTDVSFLEGFQRLQTLVLDNNQLTHQLRIPKLPRLHTLCLNHNWISNIELLMDRLVQSTPQLRYLSLLNNEACPFYGEKHHYYNYRIYVLSRLRNLTHLDCSPVTLEEWRHANYLVPEEERNITHPVFSRAPPT